MAQPPTPDWDALAHDPRFLSLIRARRAFIGPTVAIFVSLFLALPIAIAIDPLAMTRQVLGPLTLCYVYGLALFVAAIVVLVLSIIQAQSLDRRIHDFVESLQERS